MRSNHIGIPRLIVLLLILFLSGCIFTSVNQQFDLAGIGRIPFTGLASKPNTNVFVEARNFSQPNPAAFDAWVIVKVARSDTTAFAGSGGGYRFSTSANLASRSSGGDFKYWKRRFVSQTEFGICSVLRSWVRIFEVSDGNRSYIPKADPGNLVYYSDAVNAENEGLDDWLSDENSPPKLEDIHNFLVVTGGPPGEGLTIECKDIPNIPNG